MTRIATGLTLGIGWLLLLWYGSFAVFGVVLCLVGAMGLHEYFRMGLKGSELKFSALGVIIGLVPLFAALGGRIEYVALALFASLLGLACVALRGFSSLLNGFEFVTKLAFGVLYVGFCLAHLTLMRAVPSGTYWLIILTAVIAASDSGAYYVGSWFGKSKLIPAVSPGKTWAGAVGGLGAGVVTAVVLGGWLFPAVYPLKFLGVGLLLVCVGMVGDLLESIIKRSCGVKDSGSWLAGHGGLLDRLDSLLLAAPTLYYLIYFGIV
jgi:phosphatidate cytidylyltransferase